MKRNYESLSKKKKKNKKKEEEEKLFAAWIYKKEREKYISKVKIENRWEASP